ncbi:Protein NRT1/ PTR FAMILY 8.5 [Rhynchospora pubera]|uniref:Protein NRT1/ PTR FAMILY 8.5 n=1 Tax=Rhynchospora pubera TaxID=906938 RepID=A0AAV8GYV4_9POAL|nr:Protein NRT1/ PTR FAMILY 8.5 [Rhynchospora pubera]
MAEAEDRYTKDGTTDLKGNPSVKKDTGTWKACPYILANECCERLAYYGMSTNLVNFMKDRLNEGSAAAANNVTNWSGSCYITPLIGAFLADAYLGRFWTISSFMMVYIAGLTLLTLSHLLMVSSQNALMASATQQEARQGLYLLHFT